MPQQQRRRRQQLGQLRSWAEGQACCWGLEVVLLHWRLLCLLRLLEVALLQVLLLGPPQRPRVQQGLLLPQRHPWTVGAEDRSCEQAVGAARPCCRCWKALLLLPPLLLEPLQPLLLLGCLVLQQP